MSDDIIDLAEVRRQRAAEEEDEPPMTVRALDADTIEVTIPAGGGDEWSILLSLPLAEMLRYELIRARNAAVMMRMPVCRACGERGCERWHVGQLRRGWLRGTHREVVVVRVCRRSVVVACVRTGEEWRVTKRSTLRPCGWGSLRPVT